MRVGLMAGGVAAGALALGTGLYLTRRHPWNPISHIKPRAAKAAGAVAAPEAKVATEAVHAPQAPHVDAPTIVTGSATPELTPSATRAGSMQNPGTTLPKGHPKKKSARKGKKARLNPIGEQMAAQGLPVSKPRRPRQGEIGSAGK